MALIYLLIEERLAGVVKTFESQLDQIYKADDEILSTRATADFNDATVPLRSTFGQGQCGEGLREQSEGSASGCVRVPRHKPVHRLP